MPPEHTGGPRSGHVPEVAIDHVIACLAGTHNDCVPIVEQLKSELMTYRLSTALTDLAAGYAAALDAKADLALKLLQVERELEWSRRELARLREELQRVRRAADAA